MSNNEVDIPIEVSAKHVHLSQEHVDILFGKDFELTNKKELSQKGYFVANETLEISGTRNHDKISILLPLRKQTQVEVTISDAFNLGLEVHIKDSGDIKDTGTCTLKGPNGKVYLNEGVIVAARHIHLSQEYADKLNVKEKEYMSVKVKGKRGLVFDNVLVRIDPTFSISMHIDIDEGNAANINNKIRTFGNKL